MYILDYEDGVYLRGQDGQIVSGYLTGLVEPQSIQEVGLGHGAFSLADQIWHNLRVSTQRPLSLDSSPIELKFVDGSRRLVELTLDNSETNGYCYSIVLIPN